MDRATYDDYLRKFNARDYEGVLGFYAPQFEVVFAGHALKSREEVLGFYRFLHAHVDEKISIRRFVSNGEMIAMEAIVRVEGTRAVSAEAQAAAGYGWIAVPPPGAVLKMLQFIHYHLKDGKITGAYCAVFEPAAG